MDPSLYATEIVRGLFGPSIEPVLSSHTCSHNLHSGRLYIASNALCFYSNIFGFERKLLIPISDIMFTGTIRMTSIKIRSKNMRVGGINGKTCLDSNGVNNDSSCIGLVDGEESDEDGDNETLTVDSHPIDVTDDDEISSKDTKNPESCINGSTTELKEQSKPTPQKRKLSEEEPKERVVTEEFKKRQGEKSTKQASEEEYVFKSFEDRDSVLKVLTVLRAQASKNSAIVYPHHQNEGCGSFGNISLPQRISAFSGKLRGEATNGKKHMNHDTETKEKEKHNESSKKIIARCKSMSPRSDSRENLHFSVKPRRLDNIGNLGSTEDNEDKDISVDDHVDTDGIQLPNRWRCFTAPDWRNDRSSLYQEEPLSNSSTATTTTTTAAPSIVDQDTLSRSRTSSAETSVVSHQLCSNETILAEETSTLENIPPANTILADSLPSLPLKIACKLSDWVKANEISKEYKEIAVKTQSLPHSTCKSLDTFYDLFLADHAPHSIPIFQENVIGDTNMAVQTWQRQQQGSHPEPKDSITSSTSSSSFPLLPEGKEQQQRTITFSHPRNATLGPSNVDTTKTQMCQKFEPYGIILHINTVVKDVPYSDCFVVEEVWIVENLRDENKNSIHLNDKTVDTCNTCITLSVRFRVRFVKSTMFKKLIINQVRTEVSHWYQSYIKMMMTSLEPNYVSDELYGSDNHGDSAIKNCRAEVKEAKNKEQQQCLSHKLEKSRRVAENMPSPALSPLPQSSETAVEVEKGSNTELSPFWTGVCLHAQKTLTPTICLIVVLLWMIFHVLYLKQQVGLMEEELKAMKIENAFVLKTLMSTISISSTNS